MHTARQFQFEPAQKTVVNYVLFLPQGCESDSRRLWPLILFLHGGGDFITLLLMSHEPEHAAALRSLPVWAFHGAKDRVVPLQESHRMVGFLKRAGLPEVKLTVYPEAEHDSWTQTYDNPELYAWFLKHERNPNRKSNPGFTRNESPP